MKKMLIRWGFELLAGLISKSVNDEIVKIRLMALLTPVSEAIDALTDDEKDNSKQLKEILDRRIKVEGETITLIG